MSQIFSQTTGAASTAITTLTPTRDSLGGVGLPVSANALLNLNLLSSTGLTTTGNQATNTITVSLNGFNQGAKTTVGALTENLITIPSVNDTVTKFECIVAGYATPIGPGVINGFGGSITGSFITGSGIATLISSTTAIETFGATTATLTASNLGTNILIQVVGDVNYNIVWQGKVNYISSV